jgi:hypothetical protein
VRAALEWINRAAAILAKERGLDAAGGCRCYRDLITALTRRRSCGLLAEVFDHFRKVTRSYWSGLFHCSDVEVLREPKTIWNSSSACTDITSGVPAAGR